MNKDSAISQFAFDHRMDWIIITETWLKNDGTDEI